MTFDTCDVIITPSATPRTAAPPTSTISSAVVEAR